MAKRLLDVCNEEIKLKKKIKQENEIILDKIKDIDEDIDTNEREVQKFLLIFHSLMEVIKPEEPLNNLEGVPTDTVLQVVLKISELLKKNIDSFKLPEFLKSALKKIKSLFDKQTNQNAKPMDSEETSNTSGNGSEELRK